MTALTGYLPPLPVQQTSTTGLSGNVSAGTASFGSGASNGRTNGFLAGAKSTNTTPAVVHSGLSGTRHEEFGGELWEKVLIIPRTKALGFVLSTNVFSVEAWSTFKSKGNTLTAINITGTGGLSLPNPFGFPLTFWPQQAYTYTATIPQDGPTTIGNVAIFTFTGLSGADLTVTGTRMQVFSAEIDWSGGFRERQAYKTAMLPGYSDKEQRVKLRTIPRPGATFRILPTTAQEVGIFAAQAWLWQSRVWGVPWWQDAQPLLANISIGAGTVTVTTTSRAFTAGGLVLIWKDAATWEALTIQTVASGSITLSTPTTKAWNTGTGVVVVPLLRGRLRSALPVEQPANFMASAEVSFDCEVA